ncbi:hypothetical protein [Saccharicrinis aurantiacus]|uniref:hypothetical protein n=1 Tax=Saccharicrinis aurantiacus TaxID=1849719 RepID=UPI000838CA86|nr:hypothetical protein [Saccharicrinis aurantiacus]
MKNNILLIASLILISFTACTSFQFTSLQSNLLNLDSNYFLYQDDTLEVKYSFAGRNCPLQLTIYNKSDDPIFINWEQSAVIINGQSLPINPLNSIMSSRSQTSTYAIGNHYESSSSISNGVIEHSDRSGFVPPNASITINSYNLSSGFINTTLADSTQKVYEESALRTVTKHFFTKENSPLKINCFLTYNNNTRTQKNYIKSEFWCASVYKTNYQSYNNRGDQYFVSRSSVAGDILSTAAIVGVAIVAVKADLEYDDECCHER